MGQTKHKGKMMDGVSALDSRLITETLLIMEEFDIFEDDGVAASPRLQRAHDEERKRRGLPDPEYYLKLKRQKEAEIAAMKAQDEKKDESIDEDWRKKLAAAGMAGMMGIGGAAGAADRGSEPAADKYNFTDTSLEFPDPARKKLMPRTPVKDLNPVDRYELDRKMGRFSGSYGEWLKANQNNSGR